MRNPPSFQHVSSFLRHEDGVLYWIKRAGTKTAGNKAGCIDRYGYWRVGFNGVMFRAHRIVWLLAHGEWPSFDIDHINGEKADNRPSNLRLCNDSQNQMNKPAWSGGLKGVTLHKKSGKYQAQIKLNGKNMYLGLFSTKLEAAIAYDKAALKHFAEYARINFKSASVATIQKSVEATT